MRADTTSLDRPPPAVSFALWLLWGAIGMSAAGYLFAVLYRAGDESDGVMPLPFLYVQIVVTLVIYGFFAKINLALRERRNWARGALFGMVLLETAIVVLVFLVVGWRMHHMDLVAKVAVVASYFAYALRVAGLSLVMIPARHWYRMR